MGYLIPLMTVVFFLHLGFEEFTPTSNMVRTDISKEDALAIVRKMESHFFDHKSLRVSGISTQKIATALANSDGGEFIIGIEDRQSEEDVEKRWQGATEIEEFNHHQQALSEIEPGLAYTPQLFYCKEYLTFILSIKIEKSSVVHRTAAGVVYV
jgi:ATP-dependent DNA helicase RecG